MATLIDCTLPTFGRRPYHRKAAARVDYVDPETLRERRSASLRLWRQRRFYRDDPRAPLEAWPVSAPAEPVTAD